jgi:hypothetical protein
MVMKVIDLLKLLQEEIEILEKSIKNMKRII